MRPNSSTAVVLQPVTALAFSDGGDVLLSGGEDTLVHAWLLLDVLDAAGGSGAGPPFGAGGGAPASLHSWSEHTLPVTALLCGAGLGDPLVASVSLDRSCKMYSLAQGTDENIPGLFSTCGHIVLHFGTLPAS